MSRDGPHTRFQMSEGDQPIPTAHTRTHRASTRGNTVDSLSFAGLRVAVVGPLPPPAGGIANQTRQLVELLEADGANVMLVRVNPPYRPAWAERVRGVRALFRLVPYLVALWRCAPRVHLFHVMANSGWAWFLFATPAIVIARLRRRGCIVNYRGGEASAFFARRFRWIEPAISLADRVVVPSGYLSDIFARYGIESVIVPNVVDVGRFTASPKERGSGDADAPRLVVARNLEAIYDNATAIRAFARIREERPAATLTVAGSGPELDQLAELAKTLRVADAVTFTGRLDPDEMADLYRQSDLMLNPSTVDNMPNSVLEALAAGLPVVSTDVGGIPYLVEHERSALLVPPADPEAMARAAVRVLDDDGLREQLVEAGRSEVRKYTWSTVGPCLLALYEHCVSTLRESDAGRPL